MDRVGPGHYRVSSYGTKVVVFVFVNDRIPALEVCGVVDSRISLGLDVVSGYSLLDASGTPLIVEPWLGDLLLSHRGFEEGVRSAKNVEIDL